MGATQNLTAVTVEEVRFRSADTDLVGNLHHPESTVEQRLPAVVVVGAWATVKEQMATHYARALAARGFRALVFDFRSWGASGGRPRSMEDPFAKGEDIVAAAEYLATRPDVDRDAIAGLGICAGTAYLAAAAASSPLFSSVALIAPALPSPATVIETIGGADGAAALRGAATAAWEQFERTGEEQLEPAVARTAENTVPGADYYTNPERGAIPEWDNTFNPASWLKWLDYDAQASAATLSVPLLVMHSDAAASPRSVREYVAQVPGDVEQVWLDDVTQFDFYDRPDLVADAANAAARHFSGRQRHRARPDSIAG
jgi:fermentation-respiration switch protein FrsA (DUF1100 family)